MLFSICLKLIRDILKKIKNKSEAVVLQSIDSGELDIYIFKYY